MLRVRWFLQWLLLILLFNAPILSRDVRIQHYNRIIHQKPIGIPVEFVTHDWLQPLLERFNNSSMLQERNSSSLSFKYNETKINSSFSLHNIICPLSLKPPDPPFSLSDCLSEFLTRQLPMFMIKSLINIFQCMSFIINWSIQSYLFLSSTIFWAVPIQLYFHGPSWDFMGVHMGFWAGQSNDYICQFISHSTTSNF